MEKLPNRSYFKEFKTEAADEPGIEPAMQPKGLPPVLDEVFGKIDTIACREIEDISPKKIENKKKPSSRRLKAKAFDGFQYGGDGPSDFAGTPDGPYYWADDTD